MCSSKHLRAFLGWAAVLLAWVAFVGPEGVGQPAPASEKAEQPVVLDSVIAVVNGDVLLRSDLQTEMDLAAIQPLSLPPGKNLEDRAFQRLVNRALIVQQMTGQGMLTEVSEDDVQKDLGELRKQLPACVRYHCETAQGWAKFLRDHNLNVDEVDRMWHLRMQILRYIDARFRTGIRISNSEIEDYYNNTLVPQFKAEQAAPPALASVTSRIQEVLLQERVTALLQDWLKSLRDQGNIVILDSALGQSHLRSGDEGDDQ